MAFRVFLATAAFIYQDHSRLITINNSLKSEDANLKPKNVFLIAPGNEYASITNTVQAFRMLMPRQSNACSVRITAPRENRQVAQILASIGEKFCRVDTPYDPAQPDDAVLRGSINDAILVHMTKHVPDRGSFVVALGNVFTVRRTYDLPSNLAPETVWIQIGNGSPWRKDPTKAGTE